MKKFQILFNFLVFFSGLSCGAQSVFRVPIGVQIQNLNQSEAEDFLNIRVLLNLGSGLVKLDKDLKPLPALAESWEVSKDFTRYTFKLRKNFWSDGKPIKAQDFERGINHSLAPETAAKLIGPLKDIIIGIKSLDESTLEIRLSHPSSYFLSLLALPMCFPAPETNEFQITEKTPTSGPYILKSLKQDKIILEPNLKSRTPAKNILKFQFVKDQSAQISLYEKGKLDFIDKLPSSDYERFKNSPEMIKAPWLATYYIAFNVTRPPFSDRKARLAFAQSVNREDTLKIIRDPQVVASTLVPHPLEGSDLKLGPEFNPKKAKETWGEISQAPLSVDFYFDAQDKNNLIAARLQKQIEEILKIKLKLKSMEWKSYLNFIKDPKTGPSFYRFAWLSTFPDPLSYLEIFKSNSPNNHSGYKSEKYDNLVEEIARAPLGAKRKDLISQAQETLITDDVVLIPLFHYVQYLLIGSRWKGLDPTPMGLLYFDQAHLSSSP